jgi:hypothetical protein
VGEDLEQLGDSFTWFGEYEGNEGKNWTILGPNIPTCARESTGRGLWRIFVSE